MPEQERVRVHAPGRVNLIGGHTDYSGGLVLPMAIDLGTTIIGLRGHDRVVLLSRDEREPAEVDLDVTDPAGLQPQWARYVAGVVAELHPRTGFIGEVTTTIPIGTGLSSSAALEVAVALALGGEVFDRKDLAQLCREAELRASGVPCGIMDQLSSLLGVAGHALLIDCTTLEVSPVALPEDVAIVVVDSNEPRRLDTSGYAQRRDEVSAASELIGPLAKASLDDVASIEDPTLRKRARHVVTENARVRDMVDAITSGDIERAGDLMTDSHASLRDDHEVTTKGLDALVERLCAVPGVYGARLTGGGWGGCVVALADPGALDEGWTVKPSAGATLEWL
jgi:galactokinase